ncbi:hypothetical protein JHK82_034308 [Glycine max]|uniref:Uncharacterized protein n=1 Tax=Glycine max TaxID=3847 RepID=A0A0R0H707_SOYBN|nr:hypothetical protein JHK85_035017 [Glycine max]KAG4986686.1 hypothetical protein JHK86_034377 [Glycine max]KAG5119888.1 hypothetical protein JHK82_034308 [Glycine max]KAG5140877.1 hypothetical protein JHK84_034645 [Glycine max]
MFYLFFLKLSFQIYPSTFSEAPPSSITTTPSPALPPPPSFLFVLARLCAMQHSAMEASKFSNSDQNVRCHHCAGPLSKDMETSHWTVSPLIRDSFSMIGSAVGGVASAFYGFNLVMPIVQRRIKGPMWLHFLIGAPPVIVLSSACAGLAGEFLNMLFYLAFTLRWSLVSVLRLRNV